EHDRLGRRHGRVDDHHAARPRVLRPRAAQPVLGPHRGVGEGMSDTTRPTPSPERARPAASDVVRAVNGVLLPGFTGTDDPPAWLAEAAREGLAGVVLFGHNTPDVATTAPLTARLRGASPDLLVAIDEAGRDVARLEPATGSSPPGHRALGIAHAVAVTP